MQFRFTSKLTYLLILTLTVATCTLGCFSTVHFYEVDAESLAIARGFGLQFLLQEVSYLYSQRDLPDSGFAFSQVCCYDLEVFSDSTARHGELGKDILIDSFDIDYGSGFESLRQHTIARVKVDYAFWQRGVRYASVGPFIVPNAHKQEIVISCNIRYQNRETDNWELRHVSLRCQRVSHKKWWIAEAWHM